MRSKSISHFPRNRESKASAGIVDTDLAGAAISPAPTVSLRVTPVPTT